MNRKTAYFLAIGAFLTCFALILIGAYLENNILTYLGIGLLFGGSFLFALVCVFVMFRRAKKKADEMDNPNADQGEGNSSDNRYNEAVGVFAYSIHGYRHSPVKNKILTVLFLTLVLGSVLGGLICLFFKQFVAAYILFGCFGGTLIIGILAAVISSHVGRK